MPDGEPVRRIGSGAAAIHPRLWLRAAELGEEATVPAQDAEFVLSHADNVEASGFVQHLKLPHYVDFQSELATLRQLRGVA
jgi:alpha-D-ribose 1-methylphosphonate 5-triphosphate synthase subunit PhnI